jgi:serine/threonine protein kinase
MYHIAKGLAFIHENGEIHRDVKPTNGLALLSTSSHESVLYSSKDDTWKLVDLGLTSTALPHSGPHSTIHARGTPGYRAPELLTSDRYDAKVDVWALACVYYELVTGQKLFADDLDVSVYCQSNSPLIVPAQVMSATTAVLFHRMVQVVSVFRSLIWIWVTFLLPAILANSNNANKVIVRSEC